MSTELLDMTAHLPRFSRLMGLDLGSKTIGLALSDVERRLATPFLTIERKKFTQDVALLLKYVREHEVGGLVIGLPLNMDGSEGPSAQSARSFARNLARVPGFETMPMAFWDERLSTAAVTRALIEQDASRKKRSLVVDRMAAAYILQGALDYIYRAIT